MKRIFNISLLVLTISLFWSDYSYGQVKRFTPDSIKFLEEIEIFMVNSRKKEGKDFLKEFEPIWYGGKFSESQRKIIYNVCNFMMEKKLPPFPDFKNYLYSLTTFVESELTDESFEAWNTSVQKLISGRNKKRFSDYLKFCGHLFAENALYISGSTVWKSNTNNFQIEFDEEPFLVFPSLKLACYAKGDSAVIKNTTGIYYPFQRKWKGHGGNVDWLRGGFTEDKIRAELGSYSIEMKSSSYEADSVLFWNTIYFQEPMYGYLREKVLANVTEDNASYPRFESYNKRLKIENIVDSVDYDGGFSQHGPKFIGSGSEEEDAFLIFKRFEQPFLLAASKSYIIRTDRISSARTKIKIILDTDSITHPGLKLNFNSKERLLTLVKTDQGINKAPYFNSFHNVQMQFEALHWKIDEHTMEFGSLAGSTDKSAYFESIDFFKESRFDRMMGMATTHPLVRIKDCSKKHMREELTAKEIAGCWGIAETQVRVQLMQLAVIGFLDYDFDEHKVVIQPKLYHWIKAKSLKEDYDVVSFNSRDVLEHNAKLNLLNYDMRMEGVERIFLSDSHNVYIYPRGKEITLQQNRDFTFSGIVNAGRFEFFGKNYSFSYKNFKINMPHVDSLRIRVLGKEKDEYGQQRLIRVKTVVEFIKGELRIDNPGNKSGNKRMPEYPIFTSLKDSYAFYQKKRVHNGVYKRDNFYFHLDPFEFDSLDNFRNEALKFHGSFTSAGIFPEFEEWLVLQPDYSLGFLRPTPQDGFEVYGGKGKYYKDIDLSDRGLRGNGKLDYLTSTAISNDFYFFPDSTNAVAQKYIIEEQVGTEVEYPPVYGEDVYIHWLPYRDYMMIKKMEKAITMYDGESKFHGRLDLRPTGLSGKGLFTFEGAELEADLIKFKFKELDSDTAQFRLKNLNDATNQLSFATNNVNAHIDFEERKGDFVSNGGGSFIEFPQNQYIAYMDKFSWFMDTEDIELSASTKTKAAPNSDVQLEGSKFISVHPNQDSLTFYSPAAKYDVKNHIIYAKRVLLIPVADAYIYPDSGLVTVEKKAKIKTLENSVIEANTVNKYHKIYNSSVNIFGRKDYHGSGDYDYVDENKHVQVIRFDDVGVDTTIQTYATGDIAETQNFTFSPQFEYKGKANLQATEQFLTFTGTSRILHECEDLPRTWFSFTGEIDPEEIFIPIDTLVNDDEGNRLYASLMLKNDSVHVYSSFMTRKQKYSDKFLLPVNGFMRYDKDDRHYKISNLQKLNQKELPGDYLELDTDSCEIKGEGKISFGVDLGQLKITTSGEMTHQLRYDSTFMKGMMLLDFYFVENALEDMAKFINDAEGLTGLSFEDKSYERSLREILGKEETDKLISQLNLYGSFKKFPDGLNKSIFLSDVTIIWDSPSQTFKSIGKIGVGNVLKKQVNKYVDGHIRITKKRSGDIFDIYLEIDKNNWYYFNYARNIMQAVSSDPQFNTIIKEVKSDKRKLKHEKGESPYSFLLSTEAKKNSFLRKVEPSE